MQEILSPKLVEAMKTTSQRISDVDCVKLIWFHFYKMYRILRKDSAQLKPGDPVGSTNGNANYSFVLNLKWWSSRKAFQ